MIISVVNPTAGLFAGDYIAMTVRVCAGARAVLTSPSAARIFRAQDSIFHTEVTQTLIVEPGGKLDVCPEILIPHRGARYSQKTRIEVQTGGQLFFTEMVAPGRTASGEAFAYDKLEFTTDLIAQGKLAVRERYLLDPDNEALRSLRRQFSNAYYAAAFVVTPSAASESLQREIDGLNQGSVAAGASRPVENVCAIKVVAPDSISLRAAVTHMRRLVYAQLGGPEPSLRKL